MVATTDRSRVSGTAGIVDAVVEFRSATSTRALVDQAPEVMATLGFDRVLISRVDHGIWCPESMFVRSDARWADAIIEAGRDDPTRLDAVVESDVVSSSRVFAVDEVQTHPRVHPSIARVSRSDSYGVAPIVIADTAVGMVHADRYFQRRRVDQADCDRLAVVAESLAAHLSRLLLLERLRAVQETAGRGWPTSTNDDRAATPVVSRAVDVRSPLTDRELDVMRLMAAGETNYGIARRLAISPGTVKSHVSHILHKLQAANRAQAVSVWGAG